MTVALPFLVVLTIVGTALTIFLFAVAITAEIQNWWRNRR